MAETITVNAVDRSSVIQRAKVEWGESAYLGEVGTGHFQVDDDAGTISIPGHKAVSVVQSSAATTRVFTGYTRRKGIRRGDTYRTGAGREIDVQTVDLNDLLLRIAITGTDGNRTDTTETVSARLTWLLASPYLSGLVSDFGAVTYSTTVGMDKDDYRTRYANDVLAACAKACRFNYYVRWNATNSAPELVFRDDNTSTADTSTVSISNAAGEADSSTVFAPMMEAELSQDPEHVYSDTVGQYAKGYTTDTLASTATAFTTRWGVTEDAGVKSAATSHRDNLTFLHQSSTEEQLLPVTLRMRATQVNLILPGMRVNTKMTHMNPEGWGSGQYARVLRRRVTQPLNTDFDYDVALDLSPQEAGPAAAAIVQSAFGYVTEGGGNLTLPNPVTIGSLLVFVISDAAVADPAAPNISPSLARWGSTAWTKKPNSTAAAPPPTGNGVAIWYKTADTVEQTGYTGASHAAIGIYELAGADIASATTQFKNLQSVANPMTIGSLGTAATGSVAIMIGNWYDSNPPDFTYPSYTPTTGWTLDQLTVVPAVGLYFDPPFSYICHALGTGASISASGTRSALGWRTGEWCGAAILIPPV